MIKLTFKTFLTALNILCLTSVWCDDITVAYHEEVEVNSTQIRLGDIAEITGSSSKASELKELVVGKAANFGRSRYLSTGPITRKFLQPLESHWNVQISGPSRLKVITLSANLPKERLLELVENYIQENSPGGLTTLEFDLVQMPKNLRATCRDKRRKVDLRQRKG